MLETITRFLTLAADADSAVELYFELAADALVWGDDGEVIRRDQVAPQVYAITTTTAVRFHEEHRPQRLFRPAVETLTLVAEKREGDRAVGWFNVHVPALGRDVSLAAGVRQEGGGWKVVWTTLAEAPQPWTFDWGLAQMTADYPFGRNGFGGHPGTWLDVAYYRLWAHDRPPLLMQKDAKFSCHFSTACCTVEYAVVLPPTAQAVIDAIPWDEIAPEKQGTVLPVRDDGRLQLKTRDERCRFIDANNHCLVHKALGRSVFEPCTLFPFTFAETPDGVAVAASHLCHSVRDRLGLPLEARKDDLYQRLAMYPANQGDGYRLTRDAAPDWDTYKVAEATLTALLDRDDLSLSRRLWLGCRFMAAHTAGDPLEWDYWEREAIEPLPAEHRENAHAIVRGSMTYQLFLVDHEPTEEIYEGEAIVDEATLVRMMKEVYHAKHLALGFGLTVAHNMVVMLYLFARTMQAHVPGGRLSETDWRKLSTRYFHGGMLGYLASGKEAGTHLRGMAEDPNFGLWLLAYPLPGSRVKATL